MNFFLGSKLIVMIVMYAIKNIRLGQNMSLKNDYLTSRQTERSQNSLSFLSEKLRISIEYRNID